MTITHKRPVLALATVLALSGGLAIEAASASAQTVNATAQASENWAGYVASGKSFSNVSGSWKVPAVNSNSDGYSAFWVGLGGAGQQSQALEQVGTSSDVQNGQTTYYAWYELVPAPETQLNLAVHPGDQMTGKVTVNGSTVTISLADQTTGKSVTKTLQDSNTDTSSAEWIAEAPSSESQDGGVQPLPLADFGNVTFTNASATAGGHTGPISDSDWTAQPVDLSPASSTGFLGGNAIDVAGGGAQSSSGGASTGNLTGNGSSFSVSYSSTGGPATQSVVPSSGNGGGYGYGGGSGYSGGYGYGGGYPGYGDGYGGGGSYYVVPGGYGYGY
jgi:Peptidase A4 family